MNKRRYPWSVRLRTCLRNVPLKCIQERVAGIVPGGLGCSLTSLEPDNSLTVCRAPAVSRFLPGVPGWAGPDDPPVHKPGLHAVLLYSEDVIRQFCMNLNMNLGGSSACRASKPFETGKMVTWNAELPRVSEMCWLNCIWLLEKHVSK